MENLFKGWGLRLLALFDKSAWLLIAPAVFALMTIDAPMVKTLGQWSLFFLVLAGVAVIISRVVFPFIDLPLFVRQVEQGRSVAAAIVVFAVVMFVAALIVSFVLWARPPGA